MMEPSYYTVWSLAEKWAEELRKPVMEVIQIIREHATYQNPHPYQSLAPSLLIWPTAMFSAKGEINEVSVFNATKLVRVKAPKKAPVTSKFRASFRTPEYDAAMAFFNSAECPHEPTEEIKKHLSLIAVQKKDFRNWCVCERKPLPRFWFSAENNESTMRKKQRCDLLSIEIDAAIEELGGHPTPKAIMKKLQGYAGSPGSCIIKVLSGGVRWRTNSGVQKNLDIEALQKRLKRRKTITGR
jgi:hypothetical protein